MRILLTGASGFVGEALLQRLLTEQRTVRIALRQPIDSLSPTIEQKTISGLTRKQDWSDIVKGTNTVIHCAARVHVMKEEANDPLTEFRKINVEGTIKLAQQAVEAGVNRFIFLSSIKVNGESTTLDHPFTSRDRPHPVDPYGVSKMEAEDALRELAIKTKMEIVIIRPVLVYGPKVKANFRQLVNIIAKGIPLPIASIKNKRSLVSLENLVDLISTCIDHPGAAGETFLVSDGEDLSTSELARKIAHQLERPPRLLHFPISLLRFGAWTCRKTNISDRLIDSLQVDIQTTCDILSWHPPVSIDDALQKTIDSIRNS